MTRWQQLYQEDPRVHAAAPSQCAQAAADYFRRAHQGTILDLGCGAGRDTAVLANNGLRVTGVDAARSGLVLAQQQATNLLNSTRWVEADARHLPFKDGSFAGVYCFGLLHEYVGDRAAAEVNQVMSEVDRVLQPDGRLALAVVAGDPVQGLPHLRMFTEPMFDEATRRFREVEKRLYEDVGCTGRTDYRVWRGMYMKPSGG